MDLQQQADNDALATAVGVAAQELGLGADDFHHADFELDKDEEEEDDMGLNLDDLDEREIYISRPPSIRKACDLCHAAKQKCSGDRPTCTRCAAGGWQCNYAPRQRRRTVPKEHRSHQPVERQETVPREVVPVVKKRKIDARASLGFESAIDLKAAMAALDMGFGEDDGEQLLALGDDQMLESIAIDGYLADLPLSTFVNNLPYAAPTENFTEDPAEFQAADIDQHTTSALRDAIFSLNESTQNGTVDEPEEEPEGLLDLSNEDDDLIDLNLCTHPPLVPHILALLTQHGLEPKPGYSTPLTLSIFGPLARSLRLFQVLTECPTCSTSPQQTLPQLALLSRTTTILTFPFPPVNSSAIGASAQITVHGARLAGTGISEAIEQHIVGVVWDSWRASIREIFALLDRKAQDVIQASTAGEGLPVTSAETQRAGLFFQAMGRLVTAMDEVEGN